MNPAIKQQQWLLFNTEHTGAGRFRSDVSSDALRDARLQFPSYLCRCSHSGDELDRHTLEERLSETEMRKINFKAPKTVGAEGH